jgi:hypothetical protein
VMEIAQPRHQRDRVGLDVGGMGIILRRRGLAQQNAAQQSSTQQLRQNSHLESS